MSDNPDIQWALELLKPDPTYEPPFLQKYITEIGCVGLATGLAFARNRMRRRPVYAGIQFHIALVIVGYLSSQVIKRAVDYKLAERDTRLRDYIIRHPELFPEPERVKFADILQPWVPIR